MCEMSGAPGGRRRNRSNQPGHRRTASRVEQVGSSDRTVKRSAQRYRRPHPRRPPKYVGEVPGDESAHGVSDNHQFRLGVAMAVTLPTSKMSLGTLSEPIGRASLQESAVARSREPDRPCRPVHRR